MNTVCEHRTKQTYELHISIPYEFLVIDNKRCIISNCSNNWQGIIFPHQFRPCSVTCVSARFPGRTVPSHRILWLVRMRGTSTATITVFKQTWAATKWKHSLRDVPHLINVVQKPLHHVKTPKFNINKWESTVWSAISIAARAICAIKKERAKISTV